MKDIKLPQGYKPLLSIYETQRAIDLGNRLFADKLAGALRLHRVSAPLFVSAASGLFLSSIHRTSLPHFPAAFMHTSGFRTSLPHAAVFSGLSSSGFQPLFFAPHTSAINPDNPSAFCCGWGDAICGVLSPQSDGYAHGLL